MSLAAYALAVALLLAAVPVRADGHIPMVDFERAQPTVATYLAPLSFAGVDGAEKAGRRGLITLVPAPEEPWRRPVSLPVAMPLAGVALAAVGYLALRRSLRG